MNHELEIGFQVSGNFGLDLGPSFLQISVQVSDHVYIRFPRDLPSFGSHVK